MANNLRVSTAVCVLCVEYSRNIFHITFGNHNDYPFHFWYTTTTTTITRRVGVLPRKERCSYTLIHSFFTAIEIATAQLKKEQLKNKNIFKQTFLHKYTILKRFSELEEVAVLYNIINVKNVNLRTQ